MKWYIFLSVQQLRQIATLKRKLRWETELLNTSLDVAEEGRLVLRRLAAHQAVQDLVGVLPAYVGPDRDRQKGIVTHVGDFLVVSVSKNTMMTTDSVSISHFLGVGGHLNFFFVWTIPNSGTWSQQNN